MKRIFEIPIYAFSEEKFIEKVSIDKEQYFKKYSYSDHDFIQLAYDKERASKRMWKHNHIVGYIDIIKNNNDISFKLFLPLNTTQKYYWTSNKKVVIRDKLLNGYHFRISSYESNEDIINQIDKIIDGIMDRYVPKRFYLDREIYDNIKHMIDFINL